MIESPITFNGLVINNQPRLPVTWVAASPGVFTCDHHGMNVNDAVFFTGNVPAGLTAEVTYYVTADNYDTSTFSIAATVGGSSINLSDSGSCDVHRATGYYLVSSVDGVWDQDVRFESFNLPGRSGARSADSFYGGKTLVIAGTIYAKNVWTLRGMQLALQEAFDDMLPHDLTFAFFTDESTKTDLYITCRKNQKLDMPMTQPDRSGGGFPFRSPFTVQLFADDPTVYQVGTDESFVVF